MDLSERFQRRFARRTTSGRLIPEIDGLRFPAIAIVVLCHLSSFFVVRGGYGPPANTLDRVAAGAERFAGEGVYLFFIISGFILALPFARYHQAQGERVSLRAYLMRRLTRLEPPYLLSLTALLCLEIVAARANFAGRTGTAAEISGHYAASAVYLHNLIFAAPSTINPPAWSLEIEVQFYLLVPMLTTVFVVRRPALRRGIVVGACLVLIAFQVWMDDCCPRFSLSILGVLQYFLLGFLLADLYLFEPAFRGSARRVRWDIISLIGWPALFALWHQGTIGALFLPLTAFLVFVAVFRGSLTNRLMTNPWVTTVGGMCYSIYLVHFEMGAAIGRGVRHVLHPTGRLWVDLAVEGPVILLLNMLVCFAFYAAIERPCMDPRWPQRLSSYLRSLPTAGRVRQA